MVASYAAGVLLDDESESVGARLEEVAEGVDKVSTNWLRNEVVGY